MRNLLNLMGWISFNREKSFIIKASNLLLQRLTMAIYRPQDFIEVVFKANGSKKRFIAISFDCDLIEDIKSFAWLLKILKEYNLKASFACIGVYIEQYPEEHRLLIEMGHEIINHTYSHPHHKDLNSTNRFNKLSDEALKREIVKAHEVIKTVLNIEPIGFRSPHFGGLHTLRVYPILKELGYRYSSSTIATRTPTLGKPFYVKGILEIPLTPCPKHPFSPLETWALFRAPVKRYKDEDEFIKVFEQLIEMASRFNASLNFYFDPIDLKNSERISHYIFSRLCVLKNTESKIIIGSYREILPCINRG